MTNLPAQTQKLWQQDKLPILNGILLASGAYYAVSHNVPESDEISVAPQNFKFNPNYDFSYANTMATINHNGYSIYCGEGSFGGDGFVVVLTDTGQISWVFMHETANPFVNMQINGNWLEIQNNCLVTWRFNLLNPLEIDIDLTTGIGYEAKGSFQI